MMDYKEIKRKEVLFEIIDDVTNGMDIYNHNGSLWIINTKELKWVVEFTNDKTLWYNYNLFKNLFKAISLDVSENQKYITEWFESKFLNVYTVKTTVDPFFDQDQYVKETIQNGVKDTKEFKWLQIDDVEDTIQNGVKRTLEGSTVRISKVEDTIQNGVKRTVPESIADSFAIADTIQNGVKHTDCYDGRRSKKVDDTIQNGVKWTNMDYYTSSTKIN
jgi:DNA repair exonuclease SbcCD nuclease subunit